MGISALTPLITVHFFGENSVIKYAATTYAGHVGVTSLLPLATTSYKPE